MKPEYNIFVENQIHQYLKPKIKGEIFVSIGNDLIHVVITNQEHKFIFRTDILEFSNLVLHDTPARTIAKDILSQYKNFVLDSLFYRKTDRKDICL